MYTAVHPQPAKPRFFWDQDLPNSRRHRSASTWAICVVATVETRWRKAGMSLKDPSKITSSGSLAREIHEIHSFLSLQEKSGWWKYRHLVQMGWHEVGIIPYLNGDLWCCSWVPEKCQVRASSNLEIWQTQTHTLVKLQVAVSKCATNFFWHQPGTSRVIHCHRDETVPVAELKWFCVTTWC